MARLPIAPDYTFTPDLGGSITTPKWSETNELYFLAPARFLGNVAWCIGGSLRFELRHQAVVAGTTSSPEVVAVSKGRPLIYAGRSSPSVAGAWVKHVVPLDCSKGWRWDSVTGPSISAEEFAAAMRTLEALCLRTQAAQGSTTASLDHVQLDGPAQRPQLQFVLDHRSRFDGGTEGWTGINNDGSPMPIEFVPEGHFARIQEYRGNGLVFFFAAPPAFLGQKATLYGGMLKFWLKQLHNPGNERADGLVLLRGADRELAFNALNAPQAAVWSHYEVRLIPQQGWVNRRTGNPATQEDFLQVLRDVKSLWICGEFSTDSREMTDLDNVELWQAVVHQVSINRPQPDSTTSP
jgi:hypothetical protein